MNNVAYLPVVVVVVVVVVAAAAAAATAAVAAVMVVVVVVVQRLPKNPSPALHSTQYTRHTWTCCHTAE